MKKKVREIGIGALGSNLTENFKTDQGWLQTYGGQVHRQEEARYQGLMSVRHEETVSSRPKRGEIKDIRTLKAVRTSVSERALKYGGIQKRTSAHPLK
ncbi:hypothetical protein ACLB2K_063023 [Fragaria x ananassa]